MAPTDLHGATAAALLEELAATLTAAQIPDARREASDIIAAVLDAPRFWAAAHAGEVVSATDAAAMRAAAARRARGAPFAYAVGRAAFRHLTLHVDERVLIPRVETEELVQRVLDAMRQRTGWHRGGPRHRQRRDRALARAGGNVRARDRDRCERRCARGGARERRAMRAVAALRGGIPRRRVARAARGNSRARRGVQSAVHRAGRGRGTARLGARLGAAGRALRRGLGNARHRVYHSRGA